MAMIQLDRGRVADFQHPWPPVVAVSRVDVYLAQSMRASMVALRVVVST